MTWERHGDCNGCGHCCQKIARDVLVRTEEQVAADKPFYLARGFKRVDVDGEPRYVLWAWLDAPCPELRIGSWTYGKTYRCGIYDDRPETCRTFPRLPQDVVGTPCTYWFSNGTHNFGGAGSPYPATIDRLRELEAETV